MIQLRMYLLWHKAGTVTGWLQELVNTAPSEFSTATLGIEKKVENDNRLIGTTFVHTKYYCMIQLEHWSILSIDSL